MTSPITNTADEIDNRFGRRYRVIYNDGTNKFKQIIVGFLEEAGGEYFFDGRPLAGTIKLRVTDVRSMIETQMPLNPRPHRVGTN